MIRCQIRIIVDQLIVSKKYSFFRPFSFEDQGDSNHYEFRLLNRITGDACISGIMDFVIGDLSADGPVR